ncbi:hypothetical protein AOLI_G00181880 [Acnodon oligacanthus]
MTLACHPALGSCQTTSASSLGYVSRYQQRTTDKDGRCSDLITREAFTAGMYKIRFETGQYWETLGKICFYPYVEIVFTITDQDQTFHLPLSLSRFSYSTYRGS